MMKILKNFIKEKLSGDPITDLSVSRLRQFGGTSGHWGGWSKPMADYNFEKWPFNSKDLNIISKRYLCKY